MTSTADTAQHPDVTEIADLSEGLLSASRSADVRSHLDGCPLCADVHRSLEEIKELLGTLPGPPRMPAEIAGRIDAALAAEALLDASVPDEIVDVSRETSTASPTASPAVPAASPEAAGSAEPAAPSAPDAAASDAQRANRPAGRPRAATGPGRSGPARRRRRNTVLGAVFGTAAVGVTVLLFQSISSTDGTSSGAKADAGVSSAAREGKDFSENHLKGSVAALLAPRPTGKAAKPDKHGSSATGEQNTQNSPMLQPLPDVPRCIKQGIGRDEAAIAVERGTYHGSRAYLVLLPHGVDTTQVQAYVVDASCVDSPSDIKGKVLLTHSYPRR